MARFKGNFWRGIAGDVSFREHRGQQIATGLSSLTKDQMSVASLNAATTFGAASALNSYIRSSFNFKSDWGISGRLNGAMNICLDRVKDKKNNVYEFDTDSFNYLRGFEFNSNTPFKKHFFAQPQVQLSGLNLQIQLPEIITKKDIKLHPDAHHCVLAVCLGMFDIINGQYRSVEVKSLKIPSYQNQPRVPATNFDFVLSPGCMCIVALSLVYIENTYLGESFLNTEEFSPAAIFYATLSDGEPVIGDWDDMNIRFVTEVPEDDADLKEAGSSELPVEAPPEVQAKPAIEIETELTPAVELEASIDGPPKVSNQLPPENFVKAS
ncbi:MAG: hypothetical protein V4687_15780 [Bacteroidota bacterium]